jgi:hypothetical protein
MIDETKPNLNAILEQIKVARSLRRTVQKFIGGIKEISSTRKDAVPSASGLSLGAKNPIKAYKALRAERRSVPRALGATAALMAPGAAKITGAAAAAGAAGHAIGKRKGREEKEVKASAELSEQTKLALVGALMGAATMGMGVKEGRGVYKRRKAAIQQGVPGSQVMKISELTGSTVMPMGKEPEKNSEFQPTTGRSHGVGIDMKGSKPIPKGYIRRLLPGGKSKLVKEASVEHHCLIKEGQAKYPINTAEEVEAASAYFERHMDRFIPFERHEYCVKLASRASDLGLCVPDVVQKYGSTKLAEDAHVAVYRRQRMFREGTSEHSLLDEMKEKCASVKPEVLAVALENFDREHGLDPMWDKEIPDPYYSVFGVTKTAEWSAMDGNDSITQTRLEMCAKRCRDQIIGLFGEDMADEFQKNPKQIFDSLPRDSKRIIMRVSQSVEE